jgi:hypothetical protein
MSRFGPPLPGAWRAESGHVLSDQPDATLQGYFQLPARALIEVEISWKRKADFALALAVSDDEETVKQAFRLETWENHLVLLRELRSKADVALVQALPQGEGRLHLQVLLDQEAGHCRVLSEQGGRLAELTLPSGHERVHRGLRLTNRRGDVRLERLRIARWSSEAPLEAAPNKSLLRLAGGQIVYGRIVSFDPETKEFQVRSGTQEQPIMIERVDKVWLGQASAPEATIVLHFGLLQPLCPSRSACHCAA